MKNKKKIVLITFSILLSTILVIFACNIINIHKQKLNNNALYYPQKVDNYYEDFRQISNNDTLEKNYVNVFLKQVYFAPFNKIHLTKETYSVGSWDHGNYLFVINTLSPQDKEKIINELEATANTKFQTYTLTKTKYFYYSVDKNNLLIANNIDSLKLALNNSRSKKNLYTSDLSEGLNLLDPKRVETLVITDYSLYLDRLNLRIPQNTLPIKIGNVFKYTVAQINRTDKDLTICSSTFIDNKSIKGNSEKKAINKVLKQSSHNLKMDFIPKETSFSVTLSDFKSILTGVILAKNLTQNSTYSELKSYIKTATMLDFEKDILPLFNGDITVLTIPTKDKKQAPVVVLTNQNNALKYFTKLIDLIPLQIPKVHSSKHLYKNIELQEIGIKDMGISLCWGEIDKDILVLGDSEVIKIFIDSYKNKNLLKQTKKTQKNEKMHIYLKNDNIDKKFENIVISLNTEKNHIDVNAKISIRNKDVSN